MTLTTLKHVPLTVQDIQAMPAGEEMNGLILRAFDCHYLYWEDACSRLHSKQYIGQYFDPSGKIADVWPLAESVGMSVVMIGGNFLAMVPENIEQKHVRGTDFPAILLTGEEHQEYVPSKTAALAICRCLLIRNILQSHT